MRDTLKVSHLAAHEYDGWWLRFSGDSEAWERLRDELKRHGRAHARWTPGYAWDDGKAGAWWIADRLLQHYADWFSNIYAAIDALQTGHETQWIARRARPAPAPARPPMRVPSHLMQEYALLRVGADATPKDVAAAYRSLSKVYHPDTGGTHDGFLSLQQAYKKVLRWVEVTTTERIAV